MIVVYRHSSYPASNIQLISLGCCVTWTFLAFKHVIKWTYILYPVEAQGRYAFMSVKNGRVPLNFNFQSRIGLLKNGIFHEHSLCAGEKIAVDYFCHRLILKFSRQRKTNNLPITSQLVFGISVIIHNRSIDNVNDRSAFNTRLAEQRQKKNFMNRAKEY